MSFAAPQRLINRGDTVILYLGITNLHAIDVQSEIMSKNGQKVPYTFQTTYGALKVESLIGKAFGTRIELTKGYAYVLQPNAELWTQNLPHRTQILYTPDISMILLQLEVNCGSKVIEAGEEKFLTIRKVDINELCVCRNWIRISLALFPASCERNRPSLHLRLSRK